MLPPGQRIGNRYQIERMFGQGGMSNLYLARDLSQGGAIRVIKEMTARYNDPNEQKMAEELFKREAQLLATLSHPNIPKVFDQFTFGGLYYLSMEYVQGEDLGKILANRNGPLPEKDVANWGAQMATVLYYLHRQNPPIVFRDVKPSNMMISGSQVKLIDFGIARTFTSAKKGDTMRIGSPGYAPPEQYSGQTDPRSDIYALGVTLHHAVTGRDPTATQTPFLLPPARSLNPSVSPEMAAIIERATQLEPEKRYPSMIEMKRDLQVVLRNHGVNVGSASVPLSAPPASAPLATPVNPGTPIQTTMPPMPNPPPMIQPVPVGAGGFANPHPSHTATRHGMPWRTYLLLLIFAITPAVLWFNPNLKRDTLDKVMDVFNSLFKSSVPTDPGQAGNFLYQRGAKLQSCFQLLDQARSATNPEPSVYIGWNDVVVEESGGPSFHLAVLAPEGATGDEQLRGIAQAQSVLNAEGGVDKSQMIVDVGRFKGSNLATMVEQANNGLLGRRAPAPVHPTAILILGGESLKLSPKLEHAPIFALDMTAPPTGVTAVPSVKTSPTKAWVEALAGGGELLWSGSAAPSGLTALPAALDAHSLKQLAHASVVIATDNPSAIKDFTAVAHLKAVLLWNRLDQLPEPPAKGSPANVTLVTRGGRFSSQEMQSRFFDQQPLCGNGPLQPRAYDGLLWATSQLPTAREPISGVTLRSGHDNQPASPRWSVYTSGPNGWSFTREVEAPVGEAQRPSNVWPSSSSARCSASIAASS